MENLTRTMANVEETILCVIRETLSTRGKQTPALTRASTLSHDLGLESLDWAIIVVRLEEQLGVDPFEIGGDVRLTTLGDFIQLYEAAKPRNASNPRK